MLLTLFMVRQSHMIVYDGRPSLRCTMQRCTLQRSTPADTFNSSFGNFHTHFVGQYSWNWKHWLPCNCNLVRPSLNLLSCVSQFFQLFIILYYARHCAFINDSIPIARVSRPYFSAHARLHYGCVGAIPTLRIYWLSDKFYITWQLFKITSKFTVVFGTPSLCSI